MIDENGSLKRDMVGIFILMNYCPQCGSRLHREENLYLNKDTYVCNRCNLGFTQINPGEIIVTHKLIWDKQEFVRCSVISS